MQHHHHHGRQLSVRGTPHYYNTANADDLISAIRLHRQNQAHGPLIGPRFRMCRAPAARGHPASQASVASSRHRLVHFSFLVNQTCKDCRGGHERQLPGSSARHGARRPILVEARSPMQFRQTAATSRARDLTPSARIVSLIISSPRHNVCGRVH